jgi:hypothetical protein
MGVAPIMLCGSQFKAIYMIVVHNSISFVICLEKKKKPTKKNNNTDMGVAPILLCGSQFKVIYMRFVQTSNVRDHLFIFSI